MKRRSVNISASSWKTHFEPSKKSENRTAADPAQAERQGVIGAKGNS